MTILFSSFLRLNEGVSIHQFKAAAGGMQPIEHGLTDWVGLNLQPGNYVALCFVPDPKTHMSHVDEGMITQFTVQ